MARKDVSLVIRARDEASKAVSKIAAGLEDFRVTTDKLEGTGRKASTSLGAITAAVKDVERSFDSLDIDTSFAAQLEQAEKGVEGLRAESEETKKALAGLEASADEAAAGVATLTKRTEENRAAQTAQRKALREAKKDQAAAAAAAQAAADAQKKLVDQQQALPAAIARASVELRKAEQRYAELAQRIADVEKPSRTLSKEFAASGRNVQAIKAEIVELGDQALRLGSGMSAAASAMVFFSDDAARAAANVTRQEAELENLAHDYKALGVEATAAATKLRGVEQQIADTTRTGAKLAADIEKGEAALKEIGQAGVEAASKLKALEGLALGEIEQALVEQGIAARTARADLERLDQAYREAARAVEIMVFPTRDAKLAMELAGQAANEANLKFQLQDETLRTMGAAYRTAGTDIRTLGAALQAISTARAGNDTGLNQIAEEGLKARLAIRKLSAENARLIATGRGAAGAVRRIGAEAGAARPKLGALSREVERLGSATEGLAGVNQRIGSEVRGLIASYAGIYGVIQLLTGVVNAYTTLESVQARLQVANNDSIVATADDMQFAREQADRLGIGLGLLADEYSKIRIASQGSNLEGERARDIFLSIAEAGRVLRLSQEDMQGIFRATQQIISKGKVTAEELTQQLGDRLPGAVQLMADGLGVGTAELFKMMEQGQVTSDALVGFADQLDARFAGGLDQALSSASAEMGRLQNAAFLAMEAFGNAGFMEGFISLLRELGNMLKSADFVSFVERIGTALGVVMDGLALMANNFQLVASIAGAAIGLKLYRIVTRMTEAMRAQGVEGQRVAASWRGVLLSWSIASATGTRLSLVMTALASTARALSAAFLPLLAVSAGGALFAWLTSSTDFNATLEEHARIMKVVAEGYATAGDEAGNWEKALENVTLTELRTDLDNLGKVAEQELATIDEAVNAFSIGQDTNAGLGDTFDPNRLIGQVFDTDSGAFTGSAELDTAREGIEKLRDELAAGDITVDQFSNRLDHLAEAYRRTTGESLPFLDQIIASLPAFEENRRRILETELALARKEGRLKDAIALEKELNQLLASTGDLGPTRGGDEDEAAKNAENTRQAIADLDHQIRQQELLNAGREEQAELEDAARQARADNPDISIPEIKAIQERIKALRALRDAEEASKAQARTDTRITGLRSEIRAQNLIARGLERQAAIEKAIAEARAENPAINFADLKTIRDLTEALFDQAEAEERLAEAREASAAAGDIMEGLQVEIRERQLLAQGLEEQAAVEAAIRDARAAGVQDFGELQRIVALTRANFQQAKAAEAIAESEERAADALQDRIAAQEGTAGTIRNLRNQIRHQRLLADGLEEQAAVEEALREAREENEFITPKQIRLIENLTRELFKAEEAAKAAADAQDALKDRIEEVGEAQEVFTDSIRGLMAEIPALERYLEDLEEQEAFDKLIADAIESAKVILGVETSWSEMIATMQGSSWTDIFTGLLTNMDSFLEKIRSGGTLWNTLQQAIGGTVPLIAGLAEGAMTRTPEQLGEIFGEHAGDAMGAALALIIRKENPNGPELTPFRDRNSSGGPDQLRIGYSSDTITRSDGRVQSGIGPGDRITQADADRDLARRIAEIFDIVAQEVGAERLASLPNEVQAVVASLGYNYGAHAYRNDGALAGVAQALREGGLEDIALAIQNLPNQGINADRRAEEVAIIRSFTDADIDRTAVVEAAQEAAEASRDTAESIAESQAENDRERRRLAQDRTPQPIVLELNPYEAGVSPEPATAAGAQAAQRGVVVNAPEGGTMTVPTLWFDADGNPMMLTQAEAEEAAARYEQITGRRFSRATESTALTGQIVGSLEEQLAVEEAITAAKERNAAATDAQLAQVAEQAREAFRLKEAEAQRDRDEATAETISDAQFELEQQALKEQGLERELAIREAIRDARKQNPNIGPDELAQVAELAGLTWDAANATWAEDKALEAVKEEMEEVNHLVSERSALEDQLDRYRAAGDTAKVEETEAKIESLNEEILVAIARVREMWAAIGGPEAEAEIANLDAAALAARGVGEAASETYFSWDKVGPLFFDTLVGGVEKFNQAIAEGKGFVDALREGFLAFASDFLIQLGRMILQQAIFNAMQAVAGGRFGIPATGGSFGAGVGHIGGRVGSLTTTRQVNPAVFANAVRYHSGGVVGLKPGEVPIIAEEGERILTEEQQAMQARAGGSGGRPTINAKIINAIDSASMMDEALSTPEGDEVILNYMRRNRSRVKAILG